MASSNRHWPSLFKSKPCSNTTHHHHPQWQHDHHISACQKPSYSSVPGCEERSPEPKPRWNPRPEQIRILEAIFNSGMVNPPRDEIRKIRAQLQEFGQVGDANVFYWFQNRKSRSKHKQRHLQHSARSASRSSAAATATSSSSSSDRSSGSDNKMTLPLTSTGNLTNMMIEASASASPTSTSVNQNNFDPINYLQCLSGVVAVPPEISFGTHAGLWSELVMEQEEDKIRVMQTTNNPNPNPNIDNHNVNACAAGGAAATAAAVAAVSNSNIAAGPVNELQGGMGVGGAARSTVFINEVAFEVVGGPLNVREAFGDEAVLIHSSGHPVLTDEWGLTLHPLQHGDSYYLV